MDPNINNFNFGNIDKAITDSFKGVYLLILAISSNFLAETLGCKTQKLLSENMFAKHFAILFIIYFALDFSSSRSNNPIHILEMTFIVYIFYLLFTKMSLFFTCLTFVLLGAVYITSNFIDYYTTLNDKSKEIDILIIVRKSIYFSVALIILYGFISYYIKQRRDHAKNWSSIKFLFGTTKCSSFA